MNDNAKLRRQVLIIIPIGVATHPCPRREMAIFAQPNSIHHCIGLLFSYSQLSGDEGTSAMGW